MSFAKNLIGGAVIMIVATLIGVAQNTVRSRPIKLVPRIPAATTSAATQPETQAGAGVASEAPLRTPPSDMPPRITDAELAAGELTTERLKTVLDAGGALIIDARSESEFNEGHIPGAINIPYEKFVNYFDRLVDFVPMDSPVVCYCRSVTCDLSDNLARELKLMGYKRVVLYRGGWVEWTEAGYPAETGSREE